MTIALVEGKALGGGAEFVANLDMRIFVDCAQIGFVHKKMGISTAWTGAISLTKLLGPFKTIEILLSARLINGEEAYNLGLANYVISSTKVKSETDNSTNLVYHLNKPNQQSNNTTMITKQNESNNQLDSIKFDNNLKQQSNAIQQTNNQIKDNKQLETFDLKELPILNIKINENYCKKNYCKKIFKRLKKKDDKLRSITKRCKLDIDEKLKLELDKLEKLDKLNKIDKSKTIKQDQLKTTTSIKNESSTMLKKMKRMIFDAEEKFIIKPDVELSSCSEDDELLERIQLDKQSDSINKIPFDGQTQFKVGLSNEDDNTILNLVYNWLARLTIVHDNWTDLKKYVREQPVHDFDLLTHLNLKSFNHNTPAKCNLDTLDNKWQVLKSINNSVSNQI